MLLHRPGTHDLDRPRQEIEAESVAYLVCGANGLDTDAYSFGYVASWSGGDTDRIRATSERVLACARTVLDRLGLPDPGRPRGLTTNQQEGTTMTDPAPTATLVHLDPNTLLDHPSNVRDDLGDLDELTASIRQVGILEPLTVVPTDDGHRIVTGHRRKAAAIAAGLATVPCYERPDLAPTATRSSPCSSRTCAATTSPNSKRRAATSSSSTSVCPPPRSPRPPARPGPGCATPWP